MSDAAQLAVISSIAPTIMALAAFVVGVRNSRKADVIHTLVNSNLTKVKADLELANQKILELATLLGKLAKANHVDGEGA